MWVELSLQGSFFADDGFIDADLLNSLREEMMLASSPGQRVHERPEVPVYCSYDGPEQLHQSQPHSPATPADVDGGPEVYHLRINLREGGDSSDLGSYDDMPSPADTQPNQYDDAMDLDDDMDADQEEHPESSYYQPSESPSLVPGTGQNSIVGSGTAPYMNSSEPEPIPPQIPEIRHLGRAPRQPNNRRSRNDLSFGVDDELFAEQARTRIHHDVSSEQ